MCDNQNLKKAPGAQDQQQYLLDTGPLGPVSSKAIQAISIEVGCKEPRTAVWLLSFRSTWIAAGNCSAVVSVCRMFF